MPTITATSLNPALVEGKAATVQLATFTDTNPSPTANYKISIDWGDGTAPDTTTGTVAVSGGTFTVSGTHPFAEEGTAPVTVAITETTTGDTDSANVIDNATADAALTLTPVAITPTENTPFNGTVATFTDADPAGTLGDYVATISWGDGAITSGVVTASGGGFGVSGTHTYADEGAMPVNVTVSDLGGASATTAFYAQANLVSDGFVPAAHTDPNLVNPWGIASSPTSPFWVSDNGKGVATLYNGTGVPQTLVVTIPPPAGSSATAAPTGQVFNGSSDFAVAGGPAHFLFATEDGTIAGWNHGTSASLAVDRSGSAAVYKGLAIGNNGAGNFLYAANFRAGTIDVFDKNFAPANLPGTFTDPTIPVGFAPFGIQNVGGKLFVTFAKQNALKHDDVASPGSGFIDVFDLNGNFVKRFASGGSLNSPWGVALAPANFGAFGNDLLVGNFGDGRINAFDPTTGNFLGQLTDATNQPVAIEGLWGLAFGNGAAAGPTNTLFFTAGINGEADGLFGSLTAVAPTANVADADALTAKAATLTATERAAFNGAVATFTDANPAATAGDFTAAINWGDGTTSAGTVALANGTITVSGTHTYGDEGNFAASVTLSEDGTGPLTSTAAVAVKVQEEALPGGGQGTANQRLVSELYRDLLGRGVDAGGLAVWSGMLDQGGTVAQVVAGIMNDTSFNEFRKLEVDQLYQKYLHRSSLGDAGSNFWVNALVNGQRLDGVAAGIVSSTEYMKNRTDGTFDGFLSAFYQDIYNRPVDAGGKTSWDAASAAGANDQQIALAILRDTGNEYRTILVKGYYSQFLERTPTTNELTNGVTGLLGLPDGLLIAFILGGSEYSNKTA